jgi:hypothetical protein
VHRRALNMVLGGTSWRLASATRWSSSCRPSAAPRALRARPRGSSSACRGRPASPVRVDQSSVTHRIKRTYRAVCRTPPPVGNVGHAAERPSDRRSEKCIEIGEPLPNRGPRPRRVMDRTPPHRIDARSAELGEPIEDTARSVLDVIDAAGSPGGDRSTAHSRRAPPRTRRRRQRFTAEQRGWIDTWMTESPRDKEARRTLAGNRRWCGGRSPARAVHPLESRQATAAAVKVEVVVLSAGLGTLRRVAAPEHVGRLTGRARRRRLAALPKTTKQPAPVEPTRRQRAGETDTNERVRRTTEPHQQMNEQARGAAQAQVALGGVGPPEGPRGRLRLEAAA